MFTRNMEKLITPLHSVVMVKTQGITLLMWNIMFNTSMTWLNTLHITTAHPWEVSCGALIMVFKGNRPNPVHYVLC
jgi:hypothetical protein